MDLVETVVSEEDGKLYKEIEIEVPEDYPYYKNFFFAGRYLCFTVLNLRELRYILPISQEGECICGRYTG